MPTTPVSWLPRTLVNPNTTGFQGEQDVIGLSNGNILVVFADDSAISPSTGRDVTGVIYDAEGNIVRGAFQLNTNFVADTEGAPSVSATNDGGWVMAYEDTNASGTSLRVERYDSTGDSIDFATIFADPGAAVLDNPSIAVNLADNSFFVTYEVSDGGDDQIRGRKFDASLTLVGAEVVLRADEDPTNTALDGEPIRQDTAALTGGGFVTVFDEGDVNAGARDNGIEFRLSSVAGANGVNGSVTPLNGISDGNARVAALSDGGFVVTWGESENTGGVFNNNIKYRVFDANGTARTAVLTAADSANNHSGADVIGLEDGTFFIAWEDNTFSELEGQLYSNATGATIGSQINVETSDTPVNPELDTTTDGRILVTYQTIAGGNDVQFEILDPRDATVIADPGDTVVTGRVNATTIVGSNTSETLLGQNGNDLFQYVQNSTGSGNVDTIDGGGGINTFEIVVLASERLVDLNAGVFALGNIDTATPVPANDVRATLANIQSVIVRGAQDVRGSNDANSITAFGSFSNDLHGLGGNDLINAGDGDDRLDGGAGGDIMDGGAGTDTATFLSSILAGVTVNLSTGVGAGGDAQGDFYFRIENVIGSNLVDTITGANGINNLLEGNNGGDSLIGLSGLDTLIGGNGNDTLDGGADADVLDGGLATDTVTYASAGSAIQARLTTNVGTNGDAQGDTYAGIENLTGSAFGDTLVGSNGVANVLLGGGGGDTILGNSGADTLRGEGGNDLLDGGADADVLDGGGNTDTVSYAASAAGIQARLSTGAGLDADAQGDTYIAIENVIGSAFNDTIVGNDAVNNVLTGGVGGDTLLARTGNDTLIGGAGLGTDTMGGEGGNDTYVFAGAGDSAAGPTRDQIIDFEDFGDDDTIDLSGFAGALTFIGGAAFNAANQVRVQAFGPNLLVQINTIGVDVPETEFLLVNTALATIDATDFIL